MVAAPWISVCLGHFKILPFGPGLYLSRKRVAYLQQKEPETPKNWPSNMSQTYGVTYQNLCKKGTFSMGKELGQSDLPVLRTITKNTQSFSKMQISALFLIFKQHLF